MISILKGNLFDHVQEGDYIAHCISADFALGAGFAKLVDLKYNVREELLYKTDYSLRCKISGKGEVVLTNDKIFNLVTKKYYYNKPTYETLETSIKQLVDICESMNIRSILMPKIGCGLDKLSWDKVYPIICKYFQNTNVDVKIYYL